MLVAGGWRRWELDERGGREEEMVRMLKDANLLEDDLPVIAEAARGPRRGRRTPRAKARKRACAYVRHILYC